ncbi:peptidoglycan bridge formation glycyltransferase FemA/FemB family protein [Candidatus Saccharibacteria bacterium]|nr:peptidoglycan bridge formation glycyltransferase FemA/FemB family protein [Candidatus Saccharibacteria bacterium]
MKIPITQSKAWGALQDDLGKVSYREEGSGYQYLAILTESKLAKYLYLPYGPVTKDRKGFENALKSLKNLAKKCDITFIRVEPQNPAATRYFPQNTIKSHDLNPKETWVLDLSGTDDDLKQKLPSRLLRYYKSAAKNGITIETSKNPEDIKYLTDLQNAFAKQKGINTFSEKYLRTELSQSFATLYIVRHQEVVNTDGWPSLGDPQPSLSEDRRKCKDRTRQEVIAAGLVFDDKTTRYNLQGAQNDLGRKLHATGILTIQLILDAKAKNLKTFDFWGIAPEGAPKNHPWAGFTNFKKTFAGHEVQYAGTYDIVLKPARYRLYSLLRKLNRLIRK